MVVDCAALPPNLLESELFGHARGAFTGAVATHVGAFEAADGGTIFLDEIGELPLALQPKLLRVLESRTLRRIGETAYRKIDVRVLSATHRDLRTMVNQAAFREGSNLAHFHWHATRGDRRMPRAVALRIMLDALSGLHAAHEIEDDDGAIVNLVHRDVSPQNILLGMDGLARLGDFGIARASALREFQTRAPAIKGKLEYMAPEQIDCKPVDRTTDLFAMGIVLWELLTGRRLFASANQVTTIQRVCFDPIPSPRSIDPTLSLELEDPKADDTLTFEDDLLDGAPPLDAAKSPASDP